MQKRRKASSIYQDTTVCLAAENHGQSPSKYILLIIANSWSVLSHRVRLPTRPSAPLAHVVRTLQQIPSSRKYTRTTIPLTEAWRRPFDAVGFSNTYTLLFCMISAHCNIKTRLQANQATCDVPRHCCSEYHTWSIDGVLAIEKLMVAEFRVRQMGMPRYMCYREIFTIMGQPQKSILKLPGNAHLIPPQLQLLSSSQQTCKLSQSRLFDGLAYPRGHITTRYMFDVLPR